ncbi:PREDICTED: putative RNA polymerase II subunit B1 CTD phosphatase RPAP2 [Papilio xuthus]|uniref:RNA polymerase II subunit B1 CTD phosphatase RPAP2 homolog n=1 Tax=Papilio xuthus TaxID=66420 RepID=A0AAJ6Z7L4_PAPXU|nr:PREDICTED: putative RNA polymerase II subunit B1 CTD phosphatase RPAP2 [Papilio xuthus]
MNENNVNKKKKPTKIEEMTKEQIREAIIKKRECNARAQQIVESLLEKDITPTYFLQCLPEINQCHFEDVVEERCITQLCGYPLCNRPLLEKEIPKQKYKISIKTNKVYDITARKSFCSNSCFKSAMHVKKQMLTSPLWFREYEEMPKFHLLPLDTVGSLGLEVDLGQVERVKVEPERQTFISINDFTNASLNEMDNDDEQTNSDFPIKDGELSRTDAYASDNKLKVISSNDSGNKVIIENKTLDKNMEQNKDVIISGQKLDVAAKPKPQKVNPLSIVGEIVEKAEKKVDPIIVNPPSEIKNTSIKKQQQRKQPSVTNLTIDVEKCLSEWLTVDSMIFLFGEERVREMVADKGECIKEYLNNYAQSIFYNSNTYDQYQALCRKLNMLELEDRKYDAQTLQRETKPLPDYSILQEESKKMQLKVKAYFSGEFEVPVSTESIPEISQINPTDKESAITQLPLVDRNAQNALRRKIVCQHINKVLPDILRSLNLSALTISSDIRLLVNTFKLKANNITFKPIQWNLIAIIFIKLLSLKDRRLNYLLEQPTAFQHMQLLLLSYKQDGGYLDRLISWLTDVDRLLDVNDTQLTIE